MTDMYFRDTRGDIIACSFDGELIHADNLSQDTGYAVMRGIPREWARIYRTRYGRYVENKNDALD